MPICHHLAPNGEKSILYAQLEENYKEKIAHDVWSQVQSQQFLNKHGDWMHGKEHGFILDTNGEPVYDFIRNNSEFKEMLDVEDENNIVDQVPSQAVEGTKINPIEFTNHSGGAKGGDMTWDADGRQVGVTNHIHYTVDYYDKLSEAQKVELDKQYKAAAKFLGRGTLGADTYPGRLVRRDMVQANNGDAIFGVTELVKPGVKGRKGYQNKVGYSIPEGGTGYAIARGILTNKPTYVYNQNDDYGNSIGWHKWNGSDFVKVDPPVLTKNFTGIGSQEINDLGKKAIEDIYKRTLATGPLSVVPNTSAPIQTPVTSPIDTSKMKQVPFTLEPATAKSNDERETEEQIVTKIAKLYNDAIANPGNLYVVPYKNTGNKYRNLSGYTARELAAMFDQESIPDNVKFDPGFYSLIQNSARTILRGTTIIQPDFINRNEQAITTELNRILVPRIEDDGTNKGYFTPEEHKQIVDSLLWGLSRKWQANPGLGTNALIDIFDGMRNGSKAMLAKGDARGENFKHIVNSRMRLAEDLFRRLKDYGYNVADDKLSAVMKGIENFTPVGELNKQVVMEDGTIAKVEEQYNDAGELIISEGHGLQDYNDSSFELDPKDTASGRMKYFIGTLDDVDRNQQPIKNFLTLNRLVDFEQTFEEALMLLADHPTNQFPDMLQSLQESGKPNMINLANQIEKQDEQMRNEFVKVMSKQYQQFVMMLFDKKRDRITGAETYMLNPMSANRYSQSKTIINGWKESQKLSEIMVEDATGNRVMDAKRAQEKWIPWLEKAQVIKDWNNVQTIANAKKYVKSILSVSGIEMSDEMMDYLFSNMDRLTKGTSLAGGLQKQFSVNKKGEPEGIFSAFILKSAGQNSMDQQLTDEEAVSLASKNNPLYTENTAMQILAKVTAKFTPKLYSATHKSSEGKNVWDYGQNTKLSLKLKDMLSNFSDFNDLMLQTDIAKDNWYLNNLNNDPAKIQKISLVYLDGMKPTWGKRGTTRSNMSDREQMLMSIALFQNMGREQSHFISLTHSDKTTTPVLQNIPRVNTSHPKHLGFDEGGNPLQNSFIGTNESPLFRIFKSEWNRVAKSPFDYNNPQYNKGRSLFYFIPEFNYEAMQKMVADKVLTEKEFRSIWLDGKRNMTQSINNDKELKVINKILTIVTQRRMQNTIEQWVNAGLINIEERKFIFDGNYSKDLAKRIGSNNMSDIIHAAAMEYSTNYFMFNTAMSQLFYGDPALAYKSKGNASEMKQVSTTMKEYAKRLAKDIAPGQDGNWKNKTYNTITLQDVKPDESYLKNVSEKLGEAYKGVEATDAQEVTTVQEHLDVAYAYGTIPVKEYQEMSKIITDAKGRYYEFKVPEHLKFIMQPMKPVYSGTRQVPTNGVLLEDYVKTSSFPLYPPLTAGTEMEGLRTLMEKNNIQRTAYVSGKKMGVPNQSLEVFDKQGKFTNPTDVQVQASQQQLSRDGFRIQQEVPYDEEKEAIKIVSQMNKLITEGIANIEGFIYPGEVEPVSGTKIRQIKEDIRKQMISKNHKEFLQKLGVSRRDGQYVMSDKDKVYKILAEEARKKGYSVNELQGLLTTDENGELAIPLMFNTAADRFESLLMSMVKKITEIKMPGKSYVQASSVGLTSKAKTDDKLSDTDRKGIVHVGDYDGSALKTLRIEDGVVKPAQVLAPFNFFDNDGNKLDVKDFLIEGTNRLDMSKVPQKLLQLVGARIPNQGHNSMLPIEIVGFVPSNMGDLIVVPSAITKQMGADFDVDKLYTYKRPYFFDEGTNGFSMYPHTEDGVGTKEGLQTQYFDVHWSVLTHPDMVEKVLNPLDKPDLEDENKLLSQENEIVDYYDHLNQLQDFQSGKDAKTLVGSTSLSVTFNAVIQDKDLYFSKLDDDGNEVPDYITVLDEYGTELKLSKLSGYGTSTYEGEIRTKHDNLTTMQSAAVDNAKNRTLDNLNLTTNTYKAAAAFVQLETKDGKAVNLKYVTRLLTQPIIKEYDALMKQGNDSLSEEFQKDLKQAVIKQLQEKYAESKGEDGETLFDPENMLHAMKSGEAQLPLLDLFVKLDTIGQRLTELQSLANGDTNGAGPNLLSSIDKEEKMNTVDQVPIGNASQIFSGTEQGTIFNATTSTANQTLTKLLPYQTLTPIFTQIRELASKERLTNDQRRNIIRSLRSYTYTTGEHWWSDAQSDRVRLFYNSGTNKSLAQRLQEAKRTWGKDNYFLQRLNAKIGDTMFAPDFVEYQAATVGTIDEEQNHESWVSMLMSKVPEQRAFAEDLLRYTFLTGGVQDANSFVKFVPVSYIAGTSFGDMLKAREKALQEYEVDENQQDTTYEGFVQQYLQHNPDMAIQMNATVFGTLSDGQDYKESFKVPDMDDPKFPKILNVSGKTPIFFSYRSKLEGNKYLLYRKQVIEDSTYYTRIDTLGNQYSDEYNGNETTAIRSIFTENRSMAERIPGINLQNHSLIDDLGTIKDNKFKEIGITENTTFTDALFGIRDNDKLPEFQRTVANILLRTDSDEVNALADKVFEHQGIKSRRIRLVDDNKLRGAYSPLVGLQLNPLTVHSKEEAAEVVLHELAHERLQSIIGAFGFDSRVFDYINNLDPMDKQKWNNRILSLGEKHPDVVKTLEQLERVRYEAYNHLQNGLAKDSRLLNYAFGTLQEFVAHIMGGQETVLNYLNDIESSRGETLLSRIWNMFADLLEAVAKSFGMKVKEGSLLKEALAHTLKLSTLNVSSDINITSALEHGTSLRVPSEAETREVVSLLENTYGRKVTVDPSYFDYIINLTNARIDVPTSGGTKVDKLLVKLNKQINEAGDAMNYGTKEEILSAKRRYRELKEDRDQLQREKNLDLIDTIGKKQLAWVDKIMKTTNPRDVDVLNAQRTLDIWDNLTQLLYEEGATETDIRFAELAHKAETMNMQLMQNQAQQVVVNNLAPRNITLTGMDFKEKLEDLDIGTATFLSLARVKPKLYQGIAYMGKQSANNRDEEIGRVRDKLMELEARMKKNGIRPDMFIQDDNWGLVSRLSGKWHSHLNTLATKRDDAIASYNKTDKMTDAVRKKKISDSWNNYWNEIKKVGVFVDTRIFFDFNTGELKPGPGREKAFKSLANAVGSEEYAQDLVDRAQIKYKDYLLDREIMYAKIDSEDIEGTKEEQDKYRSEQKEIWRAHNSPRDFLDKMTSSEDAKYVSSDAADWMVMVPKKEGTEFYDKKYTDIQEHSNKEVPKIYEEYRTLLNEMKGYLPLTEQQDLQEDFLPIISKETVMSLSSLTGAIRNWDEKVMDSLTATEQEEMARLKGDKLPVLYTRATKKTKDIADRSTDLVRLMEVFSMMALHHKHLAPVEAAISVARNIISDVNKQKTDNNEKGLRNAMDSIKYFVDKLIYKKPAELEGKVDIPIHTLSAVKGFKMRGEIKELYTEKTKLEKQVEDKMADGDFNNADDLNKIKEIDTKLSDYDADARYLYGSKMVDTLISVNQLKALSYNPFSALSNFTFGLISVSIHANARTDYNNADMRWAMGKMMNSTKRYYSFGTLNNSDAVKIQNLVDRTGIIGDIVDTEYGKSNLHTRKDSHLVQAVKPFNWQRSGDYYAKGAMMLAMLKHKQVETSQGTKSLWDVLDERGLWNVKEYGEAPTWYNEDVSQQHEWNNFRDRIRQVGIIVFGNQDKNSPIMAKKSALLRLAGQFRLSWFSEGIATRWLEERDDQTLGRKVKGRWRTYGTLGIGTSGMILAKQLLSSLPFIQVDAFKGMTDKKGNPITDLDIENMRKNFAGLAWTLAIGASMMMIKGLAMDDDKKGKKRTGNQKRWQLVYNMVLRNHQDLMLYSSPGVLNTVTGNLLPATAVVTDAYKALGAVTKYLTEGEHEKDAGWKTMKKVARAIPIANLIPKTDYMINRSLDNIGN